MGGKSSVASAGPRDLAIPKAAAAPPVLLPTPLLSGLLLFINPCMACTRYEGYYCCLFVFVPLFRTLNEFVEVGAVFRFRASKLP
jgi:hypothetical protein